MLGTSLALVSLVVRFLFLTCSLLYLSNSNNSQYTWGTLCTIQTLELCSGALGKSLSFLVLCSFCHRISGSYESNIVQICSLDTACVSHSSVSSYLCFCTTHTPLLHF
jgi:hypothetical protein